MVIDMDVVDIKYKASGHWREIILHLRLTYSKLVL